MNIADLLDSFLHSLIVEGSYNKVAKKIGISSTLLRELLYGRKLPSFEVLRKICDSLAENPKSKHAFLSSVLLRDKKKAFALKMAIRREKWLQ